MSSARGKGPLAKRAAKAVLPPVLVDVYRQLRRRSGRVEPPDWEYLPGGWPEASTSSPGWNADSVVETQLERWPAFIRSLATTAPFGLSNESAAGLPDYGAHNSIIS